MPALLLYLLKANIALLLFYLAYHLVLRRLTFYALNRLFLLFSLFFSALYPLVDISELFRQHQALAYTYIPALPAWQVAPALPGEPSAFNFWLVPVVLFWLGTAVMAIRLLLQFVSLYRIHAASMSAAYQGIGYRQAQSIVHAFSFWQTIYLNPRQHKAGDIEAILHHEQVHVAEWHTLDVLLAELSTVFYWFNPSVWLLKKVVKENLEFIADQQVVQAGLDRKTYQYLLLKVTGVPEPQIANQFYFPSLKRRIAMMNKIPTRKASQLRLLVVLPLVTFLLFAFQNTTQPENAGPVLREQQNDAIVYYIDGVKATKKVADQLNPNAIYSVDVVKGEQAKEVPDNKAGKDVISIITKQNKDSEQVRKFQEHLPQHSTQEQSGTLPFIFIPANDPYYKNNLPADYVAFLKRNPSVKQLGWKFDNSKNWNLESIIIYLKSGKEEEYAFHQKPRIPAVEEKYGPLPALPAPPPPAVAANPSVPPPPPPPAMPSPLYIQDKANLPADYEAFLKRNPTVDRVGWTGTDMKKIILYFKSGKSETYNLNNSKSMDAAINKYGELPASPPPPPPPPIRANNK
ncbi:M56 family metallopeptidase [Pontibacter chitinilyticus]|uniref:M56 family metallopeptidase n=1 Tax=Pontibacter chitinilyticus TaxID=2674989 RepID=UPI00321BE93F